MKSARVAVSIATTLLLFVHFSWAAASPVGVAVPRSGNSLLNGTALTLETTIFSGDLLATMDDGLAMIRLPLGDQVHFGPATAATLSGDQSDLVVSLERGMVLVRSGSGQRVSVNARGILVTPTDLGSFEVSLKDGAVVVASRQGAVDVAGTNRSFVVPSGKVMRFETTTEPVAQGRTGVGGQALGPLAAFLIAVAISSGAAASFAAYAINEAQDDARRACIAAIQSVSPSAPTDEC